MPRSGAALCAQSGAAVLVFALVSLYAVLAPFAKVEESFHLQATHDALALGLARLREWDHHDFPGVVPRSFLGALALDAL